MCQCLETFSVSIIPKDVVDSQAHMASNFPQGFRHTGNCKDIRDLGSQGTIGIRKGVSCIGGEILQVFQQFTLSSVDRHLRMIGRGPTMFLNAT